MNKNVIMNYREIRKYSPIKGKGLFVSEILCMLVSPYFTSLFIRRGISPNTVTLLMIILGVMGSVLLALPHLFSMSLGVICLWGWFVMDCSDGEVARITKQFSKYGREMDYIAHLICHPLLNLSVFLYYYQKGYDLFVLALIAISFISLELVNRSIIVIDIYNSSSCYGIIPKFNICKYLFHQLLYYPNFVLFFPFVIWMGEMLEFDSFPIYVGWFCIYSLYCIKRIISTLFRFYKN